MTIKQDVLNELYMCDGVKFNKLLLATEAAEISLSPCLGSMKKSGLIEQVEGLYYLTDEGRSFIQSGKKPEKFSSIAYKAPEQLPDTNEAKMKQFFPDKPTREPKPVSLISISSLFDQLDNVRNKLNPKIPENIQLKIKVLESLADILADDVGDVLLDITNDYKALAI